MTTNNNNNPFDIPSSDLFSSSDTKGFGDLFQTPTGTNPFDNVQAAAPIVPVSNEEKVDKDEAPVVQIKDEKKEKSKKGKGKSKPKDTALSKKIKEQKAKKENLKVDKTWVVAYSAQQYNPPEDDMTLDSVREWLEIDYPELSKERCRMEVDETKKLIVPIVSGAKKG